MSTASDPPLARKDSRRYEDITTPCEYVEVYKPGGYHPTHLGDVFKDGQYKILRKLGEGAYSTVWLTRDLRNNKYAALKILVSEHTEPISELKILHHIAQNAPKEGSLHVTQLLDEFEHHGPNGVHPCLVFEVMGPNVNSMMEELPQFNPRMFGMNVRYPFPMARSILKQAVKGIAFLHSQGIAHGDFQPGNMLFCLEDIDSTPENDLAQRTDTKPASISPPVQRRDGKQDPCGPRYLCVAQPLVQAVDQGGDFTIKLSDMGGAYFFDDPPAKIITPFGLRAPELVLTGHVDNSLDVWAFGCLVFELITGWPLFCVTGPDLEDDEHMLALSASIGPLPDALYGLWTNSHLYYTAERELFNVRIGGVPAGKKPLMLDTPSMEEVFDEAQPELTEQDASRAKALIRRILQYDPSKRPTPQEILDDPFFQ